MRTILILLVIMFALSIFTGCNQQCTICTPCRLKACFPVGGQN